MNDSEQLSTVYLVDDDASVRSALTRALNAEGFHVISWASAEAQLITWNPSALSARVRALRTEASSSTR